MGFDSICIMGITGSVGRSLLRMLEIFPNVTITGLASASSAGKQLPFKSSHINVQSLAEFDFTKQKFDLVFSSLNADLTRQYLPAVKSKVVIDNSSTYRMNDNVDLIVPEVNAALLAIKGPEKVFAGIDKFISSPNCIATPLSLVMGPLCATGLTIKRLCASTYQSVSGAGHKGMQELMTNTTAYLNNQELPPQCFARPIEFNLIPQIDMMDDDGYSGEENKAIVELNKIIGREIPMAITCVRVPIFIGHAISCNIEFTDCVDVAQVKSILQTSPGICVTDNDYETPVECAHKDEVFVSRLRNDKSLPGHGVSLWIVSDNLRKGAALNMLQIAQYCDRQQQLAIAS